MYPLIFSIVVVVLLTVLALVVSKAQRVALDYDKPNALSKLGLKVVLLWRDEERRWVALLFWIFIPIVALAIASQVPGGGAAMCLAASVLAYVVALLNARLVLSFIPKPEKSGGGSGGGGSIKDPAHEEQIR